jgi:hypothetical protein
MATAAAAPQVGWFKKALQFVGKVLGIIAKDAKPIADIAAKVGITMFPQFASLIAAGDNLISKIALEAVAAEGIVATATTASGTGPQKLEQVLQSVGPAVDQWIQSGFPGHAAISTASKAGLISAVVSILNEIDGGAVAVPVKS